MLVVFKNHAIYKGCKVKRKCLLPVTTLPHPRGGGSCAFRNVIHVTYLRIHTYICLASSLTLDVQFCKLVLFNLVIFLHYHIQL